MLDYLKYITKSQIDLERDFDVLEYKRILQLGLKKITLSTENLMNMSTVFEKIHV